ncbi:hypothetical protein BC943DRAFT_328968 [Umbelopsis sp. AD052]|nr:hypothetical protein BC943DRAFT_328968 [Umbelopsis sp. AD052]
MQMISTELSTDTLKAMAAPIASKKRKISCLSCRARKTKCDGQKPCGKCLLKGKASECVYAQTSGPVGRPAKNAVVNKMVLLSQSTDSQRQQFVYENLNLCGLNDYSKIFTPPSHSNHFSDDGAKLSDYISGIFSVYFGTGLRFDELETSTITEESGALVEKSESIFQLFDLKQHYSWLASEGVSNLVVRCSDLKLTNFRDLNVYGHLLKTDRSDKFFERQRTPTFTATVRQSPLKSLTPHQALQYTDVFFSVHPWAPFILNRTQILQEYFTDEGDPLLLSVIFGIAKYFAKQMSEGVVFSTVVRRGDRNEFLNYAHSILSETSAKTTVAKFQAVALLSYFEITYGHPKKGTTLTALSYVMLGKLAQTVNFRDKHLAGLGSLQRELVRNAWWCIYNNTVTGTIEFGQVPRDAIMPRDIPFPKRNCEESESYQLDKSTGNTSMFIAYNHIYESFFVASVVSDLLAKIWRILPEPDRNMFRINPTVSQVASCPPEIERKKVREQILDILGDFEAFITAQQKHLTEQQVYHLDMAKYVLFIHAHFLKEGMDSCETMCYVSAMKNVYSRFDDFEVVTKLPPGTDLLNRTSSMDASAVDDEVMEAVWPQTIELIDKSVAFLDKREGNTELLHKAPGWIIQDGLETGSLILMIQMQKQSNVPQAVMYLEKISKLLEVPNVYNSQDDVKRLQLRIQHTLDAWNQANTSAPPSMVAKTNERVSTADILAFYPTPPPNTSYENIVRLMSMSPGASSGQFESDAGSTEDGFASSPLSFDDFPENHPNQDQSTYQANYQQQSTSLETMLDIEVPFFNDQFTQGQTFYPQQTTESPVMDTGNFADLANIDATALAMEFGLSELDTNMLQQHMNFDYLQEMPLDLFVLDDTPQ